MPKVQDAKQQQKARYRSSDSVLVRDNDGMYVQYTRIMQRTRKVQW